MTAEINNPFLLNSTTHIDSKLVAPANTVMWKINPGLMSDSVISYFCNKDLPMISPFLATKENTLNGVKVPSFGLSSAGYDIRLAPEWKIFTNPNKLIDVLNYNEEDHVTYYEHDYIDIPPGTTVLSRTVEYFNIPDNVMGICVGKSTLARIGVDVLVTPLEPGWSGHLVVEMTNNTPAPIRMYSGIGVAQILFYLMENKPNTCYSGGKYDKQTGITPSKV